MTSHPGEARRRSSEEQPLTLHPIPSDPETSIDSDHDLVQHSRDLLCVHDLQGRLLSVNPGPARLLGYSVEEILQTPMRDLIDPEFRDQFDAYLREIESVGEAHGVLAVMTRTGERRLWEYHNTVRTEGVETPVVRGMAHDVTERVQAEKERKQAAAALEESEKRFRAVYEWAPVGISLVDVHGGWFLQVNPKLCEIVGRTEEEMLRLRYADIMHPEDRANCEARTKQLIEEKVRAYKTEKRYVRPDGAVVPVSLSAVPMWAPGEKAQRLLTIVQDITERRQAEEALREGEARERARAKELETILDTLPIPVLIAHDPECRHMTVNRTGREHLRLEPGANASMSAAPGERPRLRFLRDGIEISAEELPMQQAAATGRSVHEMPSTLVFEDGTERYELSNATPLLDNNGKVRGAVGAAIDITERVRAEQSLRESEERLRLAQEAAQIGTFERNFQTGEVQWTPQMEALYGIDHGAAPRTEEEFLELIHPDDREKMARWLAQSKESGEANGEWRVIWPDRTVRWIAGRWRVFKDASGKPERAIGVDFDITERKQVEEDLRQAKKRLTEEKLYLEHEIDTELGFEDIVGQSKALKAVMESIGKVAASDATVLLLGETGTGKELMARAIHRLSRRSGNPFIKMNCAAIPSGLLESELFGNEKGAFTGAVSKKIGRLELADKGTLFLDEIGEISLPLQPKLLRVLQDQEFERLGGTKTLKVNFRLIAATNRDLAESVRENEFRGDLYYRLSVFPILLPPLRERRDDIPLLVEHFVQKIARRMNKSITSIPKKTMDALIEWNWPGNVRELENFIERSLILTHGSVLAAPLSELQSAAGEQAKDETLAAAERQHILNALRESHGQISGLRGAAARLGLKRTTLQSKLKHLGINPRVPPAS